ncbi:hypothetical protein H257_08758 [Aphanomyces astaci]|uniref:UDENN domain-containing protein n=1 Tax=Aphanomyces astaci TaxID=112090 RepID=W4GDF6_APHAT|nr:hypothetical protein H257_08758 [Aphanomyces astaci]ETV77311.1 hypothetical protein H257_08758 [Aphanomyces astaci]|eukprot:XP_009833098.1 hypothetical protein H257_08758 [Aphanomyces astaci]
MSEHNSNDEPRLIEYFFVASKIGSTHSIVFQYPPQNHDQDEYPQSVLLFMFPSRSADAPPAMYNAFVLTTATGTSLHGASICISSSVSNNYADAVCLTSLCIVSKHPFYTSLLQYLEQLAVLGTCQHRWNTQANQLLQQSHHSVPSSDDSHHQPTVHFVEQCLTNLLHEVPVPRVGSAGVLCSIAETDILLQAAPLDWEFVEYTFQLVEPENLVALVHHALLEHSILILGTDNLFITAVATTIRLLLAPLQWDHVFIPVVPHGVDIATLLDAPVPFIAGAHASQVPHPASLSSPTAVVRFDMRDNRLHGSRARLPVLPPAAEALVTLLSSHLVGADGGESPPSLLPHILQDRRMRMHARLRESVEGSPSLHKSEGSNLSTSFLTSVNPLRRTMVKWFRRLVCEYRAGLAKQGTKKFLAQKTGTAKVFFTAWSNTSAFQQYVDQFSSEKASSSGGSSSSLRNDRDDSDDDIDNEDDEPASLGLDAIHVPLRPAGHDVMLSFFQQASAADEAAIPSSQRLTVSTANLSHYEIAFPTLTSDALGASRRPKLPYEVPEVACKKSRKPNSTVVEWLDNWLHGGKLAKSPPAIFHRAKTIGSHLSPRLNFHRTKTNPDVPDHPWLHTACVPECMANVANCTRVLDDLWATNAKKPSLALEQAYVELIHTLGACRKTSHRHDLEAVWETCLGASPLGGIFNQLGHWRPFSWLIKTWMDHGDVALAVTWLAQIQVNYPHHHDAVLPPTSPTSPTRLFSSGSSSTSSADITTTTSSSASASMGGGLGLAPCMEVELEPLVHRVYATFGMGSLGLILQPFNDKQGCHVAGFQHQDERCRIEEGDVVDTIGGKPMMLSSFHDIVTCLVESPRPMTVSFIRGLTNVEDVFQTSGTVKLRPRREMHDRFGELFERGIRLTLLADCATCGHRLSEADLQTTFRSTCPSCQGSLSPFFCVRCMDQPPSSPIPYFSWSYLHARMTAHDDGGGETSWPLRQWHAKDPHVYWNIVVKCLSLDCPFDSFLVDLNEDEGEVEPAAPETTTSADIHRLCQYVLGLPSSATDSKLAPTQALARRLLRVGDLVVVDTSVERHSKVHAKPSHKWRDDRVESMATTEFSSTTSMND